MKYAANSCVNSQRLQRAIFIRANTNRVRFLTRWLRTESHQTPVGIKQSQYSATALAAVAAPEKLWCQSVSRGCLHSLWLSS